MGMRVIPPFRPAAARPLSGSKCNLQRSRRNGRRAASLARSMRAVTKKALRTAKKPVIFQWNGHRTTKRTLLSMAPVKALRGNGQGGLPQQKPRPDCILKLTMGLKRKIEQELF